MRFHTTLLQADKTATGIIVPDEVVESLGAGKRPPVKVTINGFTYRNTIAVMGGVYMVGVSAANRAGAGVAGGDEIVVEIELDIEPRVVEVPADLAAALDAEPRARETFDRLSNSNTLFGRFNVQNDSVVSVPEFEGASPNTTREVKSELPKLPDAWV